MDKTIVIPVGHKLKRISEADVRRVQKSNLNNISTYDGKLIDAVLSFFIKRCIGTMEMHYYKTESIDDGPEAIIALRCGSQY